jgi:hypothetical protein
MCSFSSQGSSEDDPDEGVKDLVDLVLKKMDRDRDGRISLVDYREAIAIEPLLLEAFGPCLPTQAARSTFLAACSSSNRVAFASTQSAFSSH